MSGMWWSAGVVGGKLGGKGARPRTAIWMVVKKARSVSIGKKYRCMGAAMVTD